MKLSGTVISTSTDTRSIIDKATGIPRQMTVTNILIKCDDEILACRSFNSIKVEPVGKSMTVDVRKYERKGLVAECVLS